MHVSTGQQQEEEQACAEAAGRQLSATVRLILQLVRYGFSMSADDMAVLEKHFSPKVGKRWSLLILQPIAPRFVKVLFTAIMQLETFANKALLHCSSS